MKTPTHIYLYLKENVFSIHFLRQGLIFNIIFNKLKKNQKYRFCTDINKSTMRYEISCKVELYFLISHISEYNLFVEKTV